MSIEQPGLVKISTGGSASTTSITIDGVTPMVERATIIIDPKEGHNLIKLHCISIQHNKVVQGGVQTFCGISEENFEFMTGLLKIISGISDLDLDQIVSAPVKELLNYIHNERQRAKLNEPDSEQS